VRLKIARMRSAAAGLSSSIEVARAIARDRPPAARQGDDIYSALPRNDEPLDLAVPSPIVVSFTSRKNFSAGSL
jgi:hypothetical protein